MKAIICDRCGKAVPDGKAQYIARLKRGEHIDDFDLCGDCGEVLLSSIKDAPNAPKPPRK